MDTERHPDPRPTLRPERNYPAICHVCAREFIVRAEFWSTSASARGKSGDERLVTTCNILRDDTAHEGALVRFSYESGGFYDLTRAQEALSANRSRILPERTKL